MSTNSNSIRYIVKNDGFFNYFVKEDSTKSKKVYKVALVAGVVLLSVAAFFSVAVLATVGISLGSSIIISSMPILTNLVTYIVGSSYLFPVAFGSAAGVAILGAIFFSAIRGITKPGIDNLFIKKTEIKEKEYLEAFKESYEKAFTEFKKDNVDKAYNELFGSGAILEEVEVSTQKAVAKAKILN